MKYDRDAIERALKLHHEAGRIGQWMRNASNHGHTIMLNDFAPVVTRTLRESHLVVLGLASAAKARGITQGEGEPPCQA